MEATIANYELAFRMQIGGAGPARSFEARAKRRRRLYGLDDRAHGGVRPRMPAGAPAGRARRALRRTAVAGAQGTRPLGSARGPREWASHQRASRPTSRSPALLKDLKVARAAGRHAGGLGRRVRPHAVRAIPGWRLRQSDRARSQPVRLHDVDGGRRREGRASCTARPTSSATSPSRTRSTCTTCTPRCCTCSASTTSA